MKFNLSDIAAIVGGELQGDPSVEIHGIYIDSRNLPPKKGILFVAIKGKQHDSHKYINDVVKKDVSCILLENVPDDLPSNVNFVKVENTVEALQKIARANRQKFDIPVLGITGSNGKTIVKEWLYYLLSEDFSTIRSPKSFNSQIGVPLSVCLMEQGHELAIFEAGISEPGEMEHLQRVINPSIGIFTNLGDAHQEYFESLSQKTREKFKLFTNCKTIIYCKDNATVDVEARKLFPAATLFAWSAKDSSAKLYVSNITISGSKSTIDFISESVAGSITIPFCDNASVENAITCLSVILVMGRLSPHHKNRFSSLPPVAMRLELLEGKNDTTIINDTYNADIESLKIAIDFLNNQKQHDKRVVILSDVQQTGMTLELLHDEVFEIVKEKNVDLFIGIGPDFYKCKDSFTTRGDFYFSTEHFLQKLPSYNFSHCSILIKGARQFRFERVSSELVQRLHQTVLEVNLSAMVNNLNYFRSLLKPETKIVIMVKAFSYGSGSYEIASLLQHHRVDYLAVAFADEGVELRNAGIQLPIIVMNPEPETFGVMIEFNLEPEIYSFKHLHLFKTALEQSLYATPFPVHVKFDTGMARMGFDTREVTDVISTLKNTPGIRVASVFSHLAGSDEQQFDAFTLEQISRFKTVGSHFDNAFSYPILKHILNSAGIERFPEAQLDMVRLGIGLYGISAINSDKLQAISELRSVISQIRDIEPGQTVGYGRKGKPATKSRIAVIPIGYADGLNRQLSNGLGCVLVNAKRAPIIGNICMDATMIDITGIDATEGDSVVVFGKDLTISEMAGKLHTIPYEILTSVARRVKRVYISE